MDLTKKQRIARHKQFMQANWPILAAFGWEHHHQQGRGAVVVDENDFVHAEVPQYAAIKLRYLADGSPRLKETGGWPDEKEANWVKTYEPTLRIVVLIVRDDGGTSGYMIGGSPPPAECFAQQQAKMN